MVDVNKVLAKAAKGRKKGNDLTAKELGIPTAVAEVLAQVGILSQGDPRRGKGRGRPSFQYSLTRTARDRVRKQAAPKAKASKPAPVAPAQPAA